MKNSKFWVKPLQFWVKNPKFGVKNAQFWVTHRFGAPHGGRQRPQSSQSCPQNRGVTPSPEPRPAQPQQGGATLGQGGASHAHGHAHTPQRPLQDNEKKTNEKKGIFNIFFLFIFLMYAFIFQDDIYVVRKNHEIFWNLFF